MVGCSGGCRVGQCPETGGSSFAADWFNLLATLESKANLRAVAGPRLPFLAILAGDGGGFIENAGQANYHAMVQ